MFKTIEVPNIHPQTSKNVDDQKPTSSKKHYKSEFLGKPFCSVLITGVFQQRLCDISEIDARKEGFVDKEEFLNFCNRDFKRLGSGVVTVYEFQVCT